MTITYLQTESILKTLPIGYYLNRNISVKLANTESSYYAPMTDEIVISFQQIDTCISNIDETLKLDLEQAVRCMLYHELSHALLTPKSLRMTRIVNIFEDERIETLLKSFYMNVDFKTNVKLINGFKGEIATDFDGAFYHLVRYRQGPISFLERVKSIITKFQMLENKASTSRIHDRLTAEYEVAIENLYEDYKRYCTNLSNAASRADQPSNISDILTTLLDDEQLIDGVGESADDIPLEIIKQRVAGITSQLADKQLMSTISATLLNANKLQAHNSSAINSYSGRFDIRSTARDDYKYFVQKNRQGNVKAYGKIHMNLFIDESGSFANSVDAINKLLYALTVLEKQYSDFDFTLITCGDGQRIRQKRDRFFNVSGGNNLTQEIFSQYASVQERGSLNVNLICFDGDAYSDDYGCKNRNTFAAFNHDNCMIISDKYNEKNIRQNAPRAKQVFTKNYASELLQHVTAAIKQLVR